MYADIGSNDRPLLIIRKDLRSLTPVDVSINARFILYMNVRFILYIYIVRRLEVWIDAEM